MQINSSQQAATEVVTNPPSKLLASMTDGETVEARVISRTNAEQVKLRVGDNVVTVNTKQPLLPGQSVVLEKTSDNGVPALKLTPISPIVVENPKLELAMLKVGQRFVAEVVQIMAENKLLISTQTLNLNANQSIQNLAINGNTVLPKLIQLDVSALPQRFNVGKNVDVEILKLDPLQVKLRGASEPQTREQSIQQFQRQMAPLLDSSTASISRLNNLVTSESLPEPVKLALQQLIQNVTEKSALQQVEKLQQVIGNSGLFMEAKLKQGTGEMGGLPQDFKANLLRLSEAIQREIQQPFLAKLIDNPVLLKQLPTSVQQALNNIVTAPQDMRTLPSQVASAIAMSSGKTPIQLLVSLIAGLSSTVERVPNSSSVTQSTIPPQVGMLTPQQPNTNADLTLTRNSDFQMLRDFFHDVESVKARVQFNQLSMASDSNNPNNANVWLFDLPVKDKQQLDMLQFKLEQHQHGGHSTGKDDTIWQVQLNLETQNLGPMQVRISLHNQDAKIVMLAEKQHSADLLNEHLDTLNNRLSTLGINVSHLSCRQSKVEPLTVNIESHRETHLLDISV